MIVVKNVEKKSYALDEKSSSNTQIDSQTTKDNKKGKNSTSGR